MRMLIKALSVAALVMSLSVVAYATGNTTGKGDTCSGTLGGQCSCAPGQTCTGGLFGCSCN